MDKDLYHVLGVERNASANDIKKAYKRMAMRYHPDRNDEPGAENRFKDIQQAYGVLANQEKKEAYDRFGTMDFSGMNDGQDPFNGAGFSGFSDVFNNLFQGGRSPFGQHAQGPAVRKGRDLSWSMELELEAAVRGCQRKLKIKAFENCRKCNGSGTRAKSGKTRCPRCHGSGSINRQVAILLMQETCSTCSGTGQIIKDPCPECTGDGRIRKSKTVAVNIPAGVDDGDILRIAGQGEAGKLGGPSGDLLVNISVTAHPVFTRNGDNLDCEMPISFAVATLGGEADVPTLDGYRKVTLPKGLQSGKRIMLRGMGIQGLRTGRQGNLYCTVVVETPQNLNGEQTKLLEKFNESLLQNPRKHCPASSSWLGRVKQVFSR